MAKFGGGFGGGNMQQLMKQAQKLQQEMQKAQEELQSSVVTGSVGGGLVTVDMTGAKVIQAIHIKPELADPEDIEMLEDSIIAACNDAYAKVEELTQELMGPYANIGGGLF